MRAARCLAATTSILGLLAGCGSPTDPDADPRPGERGVPGEVATVEIVPSRTTLRVGDTTALAVQLRDFAGSEAVGTVTWFTLDFTTATVSARTGLVVAVAPGQARIVATTNGKADTALVDVPFVPIASMDIAGPDSSFLEDRGTQLVAIPRDAAGVPLRGKLITWSSSDATVATVSSTGAVTGRGPGIVTISAKGEGVSGTRRLAVQPAFVSVTAGAEHACGVSVSGAVLCWGRNDEGQLGDGTTESRNRPVRAKSQVAFMAVYAGPSHTCGLTRSHAVHCWGANDAGQLGDGTRISRATPAPTVGAIWFYEGLQLGPAQTCGSTWWPTNPALNSGWYCWGDNTNGQFGQGSRTTVVVPTWFSREGFHASISFGTGHACAVSHCWGDNSTGQLGDGTTDNRPNPTPIAPVAAPNEIFGVTAGPRTTCAAGSGRVWCWGAMFDGSIATSPSAIPSGIFALPLLAIGERHGCVMDQARDVYCWGRNESGQVGDGTTDFRSQPTAIAGNSYVASVSAGLNHTCVLSQTRDALCWGRNDHGQLGDGSHVSSPTPRPVLFR